MNKTGFVLGSILLFSMISSSAYSQKQIPVWNLEDLKEHLRGSDNPILINFWATWCKPCIEEIPLLTKLNQDYQGIEVVFLSLDFEEQIESRLKPFVEENLAGENVALLDAGNPNVWIDLVNPKWSGAIPATVLIHKGENYFVEGKFTEETLKDFLKPIITE